MVSHEIMCFFHWIINQISQSKLFIVLDSDVLLYESNTHTEHYEQVICDTQHVTGVRQFGLRCKSHLSLKKWKIPAQ